MSLQKLEGKNVSVDEYKGYGSIISINPQRAGVGMGACCDEEGNCTITTEAECTGTFQGIGTVCDPNPCGVGACCVDGGCSILSESDCTAGHGYYWGDGSSCDPDPCGPILCCFSSRCEWQEPTTVLCGPDIEIVCAAATPEECANSTDHGFPNCRVIGGEDCCECNCFCDRQCGVCCGPDDLCCTDPDTGAYSCADPESGCPEPGSPFDVPFFQDN